MKRGGVSLYKNDCLFELSEGLAVRAFFVTVFAGLCLLASTCFAQGEAKLQIPPQTLPNGILHSDYGSSFVATGGTAPRMWAIESGDFPPGLNLDATTGRITGRPRAGGTYRFRVKVTDSAKPPATASGNFLIQVVTAFALEWRTAPHVTADGVYGSVRLANQTPDDVDLTFIVVAVNEFGKAFALGYEHSIFAKGTVQQEIVFGSSLPAGIYAIHVDAIGEVPEKDVIYRTHLQSTVPLQKP